MSITIDIHVCALYCCTVYHPPHVHHHWYSCLCFILLYCIYPPHVHHHWYSCLCFILLYCISSTCPSPLIFMSVLYIAVLYILHMPITIDIHVCALYCCTVYHPPHVHHHWYSCLCFILLYCISSSCPSPLIFMSVLCKFQVYISYRCIILYKHSCKLSYYYSESLHCKTLIPRLLHTLCFYERKSWIRLAGGANTGHLLHLWHGSCDSWSLILFWKSKSVSMLMWCSTMSDICCRCQWRFIWHFM